MRLIDELGFVPLSKTGAELLFEVFSQRYERGSVLVTSNLPFDEWTEVFGSERLTGALLDRLTHHVHILEMNVSTATASSTVGKLTSSSQRTRPKIQQTTTLPVLMLRVQWYSFDPPRWYTFPAALDKVSHFC